MISVPIHQIPTLVVKMLSFKLKAFSVHNVQAVSGEWQVHAMPDQEPLLLAAHQEMLEDIQVMRLANLTHMPFND